MVDEGEEMCGGRTDLYLSADEYIECLSEACWIKKESLIKQNILFTASPLCKAN